MRFRHKIIASVIAMAVICGTTAFGAFYNNNSKLRPVKDVFTKENVSAPVDYLLPTYSNKSAAKDFSLCSYKNLSVKPFTPSISFEDYYSNALSYYIGIARSMASSVGKDLGDDFELDDHSAAVMFGNSGVKNLSDLKNLFNESYQEEQEAVKELYEHDIHLREVVDNTKFGKSFYNTYLKNLYQEDFEGEDEDDFEDSYDLSELLEDESSVSEDATSDNSVSNNYTDEDEDYDEDEDEEMEEDEDEEDEDEEDEVLSGITPFSILSDYGFSKAKVVSCNNLSDIYTYSLMSDIDAADESDTYRNYLVDLYKEIAVACQIATNEGIEITDADLEQAKKDVVGDTYLGMFEDEETLNSAMEDGTFNLFYFALRNKICSFLAKSSS